MTVLSLFVLFNGFRIVAFVLLCLCLGILCFCTLVLMKIGLSYTPNLITTFLIYIGDQTLTGLETECISKGRDFSKEESCKKC